MPWDLRSNIQWIRVSDRPPVVCFLVSTAGRGVSSPCRGSELSGGRVDSSRSGDLESYSVATGGTIRSDVDQSGQASRSHSRSRSMEPRSSRS